MLLCVVALCVGSGAVPQRAMALGSCGKNGSAGGKIEFKGAYYWVTLPIGYDPAKEWPVVIGMHGDEGSPEASGQTMWSGTAPGNFLYIAPKSPTASGSWYEPMEIANTEAWFDDMLRDVFSKYNVDLDRVYAWGLSGGAEFLSFHGLSKLQNVLAAIEFNMGGNYWGWALSGQPKRTGTCKIPTRFAVNDGTMNQCNGYVDDFMNPKVPGVETSMGTPATGDFLCATARALHLTLLKMGHMSIWSDWASISPCVESRGHCWDDVQAQSGARDWFLQQKLCGMARPVGCGMPEFGEDPKKNVTWDPSWLPGGGPGMTASTGGMGGTSGTGGTAGTGTGGVGGTTSVPPMAGQGGLGGGGGLGGTGGIDGTPISTGGVIGITPMSKKDSGGCSVAFGAEHAGGAMLALSSLWLGLGVSRLRRRRA
jgi:hypothetical protein